MRFKIEIDNKNNSSIFVKGENFEQILDSLAVTFKIKADRLKAFGEMNPDGHYDYLIFNKNKKFCRLRKIDDNE